jgi:hypothetical protein
MSEKLPERVWLSEIGLYHVMAHGGSGDVLMSDNASRVSFKPYIRADIADLATGVVPVEVIRRLVEESQRAAVLIRLLTVRQIVNAGNRAINAAGLNPYAMNEGLATGDEAIDCWSLRTAIAAAEQAMGEHP